MNEREILLALFHPNEGHKPGCLTHQRGPCQCGWSEAQIQYNAALRAAHQLASDHYGKAVGEGSTLASRRGP